MGALTSNRKRDQKCFTLNNGDAPFHSSDSGIREDLHVSKKPKYSPLRDNLDWPSPSKSAASLLSRYPEPALPLKREVHAPFRILRYGCSVNLSPRSASRIGGGVGETKTLGDSMGNFFHTRYNSVKDSALRTLRYFPYFKKEKEVNDVVSEPQSNAGSEDSSIQEIEIEEFEREVESGSMVSDQRCHENGYVDDDCRPDLKISEWRFQPSSSKVTELMNDNVKVEDEVLKISERQFQPSSSEVTELMNGNVKVEDTENMLESLSLNSEEKTPLYGKLRESAEKRNPKLNDLKFQIKLTESRCSSFRSLRPRKKPVEKPVEDTLQTAFAPLTKEEEDEVSIAFRSKRKNVLVTHVNSNIEITAEIFQCLRPGTWLNDEVINLYLELLKEREKREPTKFLKCHFFSTFFYKKLVSGRSGYDYKSVRRWTTQRKLGYGLFECDKIFVPIHKEIHWCLAVINKKDEKFQYLDSLKGTDARVLKVLARYIEDEVKDKCGENLDVSTWDREFVEDLPAQENGSDCGMFMIKYVDFYSRGMELCFKQAHMPYLRLRTAKEILRLRAD